MTEYSFDQKPAPPKANKIDHSYAHHGYRIHDPYAWIRDDNWQSVMQDPSSLKTKIRAHLDAENSYTKSVLNPIKPLSSEIFEEMKGRLDPRDEQVPMPDGPYAYYHRYREGDQHGIFGRKAMNTNREIIGEEDVFLDLDALATGHSGFFDLGSCEHSRDHSRFAYSVDVTGSENYEVFVSEFSGKPRTTAITKSTGSIQWDATGEVFFWIERDEFQRPSKVFAKNILKPNDEPKLIYEEFDPGFFVSIGESDSGQFILINSHNHTTSEIWIVPSHSPFTAPHCFAKRVSNLEYSIHDHEDYFYILTNRDDAVDFKVMRRKINESDQKWEDYIPHTPGSLILSIETYQNHMVRLVRRDALPRIIIRDMTTDNDTDLAFEDSAYSLGLSGSLEYNTDWLRFSYQSPTTPSQIFDLNMSTGERVLRKTQHIPSGHESSDYKTDRIYITARDSEKIPVTLLYKKTTPLDSSAPLLLYGYGSYGITIPASFRTHILSLIDRGFVYAIAHIRGGMGKGYQWYLDGKLETKTNTFNDYVDVGRALVERNYTSKGKVVAHGGSAGGLLVGAALNQAPDLFGAVIAAVPFVDVLNTMLDDSLPLTPPEWPEWGNPKTDITAFERIADYSPYDNLKDTYYPPILITGGLTDPRVTYWEPAKWAARLRDHQLGDAPILLKINMEAGHQGESGRYDSLKETALEYAFAVTAVS